MSSTISPATTAGACRRSRSLWVGGAIVAVLLALVAVPWYATFGVQRLLVEALTVFSMALAWNLLAGYGGLVSVGHQMFVGVGAYALFAISNRFEINPWVTLPLAGLISGLFAMVSAVPLFRLSGPYFAVATWVLAEVLRIGASNTTWLGSAGGMPLETIREYDRFTRNAGIYWAALTIGVASLACARAVLRGRLGMALMSIRDSEVAAASSGVSVQSTKFALWVIAGVMTGLGGAVAYMNTLQVTPNASFSQNWTAIAIFTTILGGIGTLEGPILGTVLYFALRELFADHGTWYFIGLGVLAMVMMVVAPQGAWSLVARKGNYDLFGLRRRMKR